MIDALTALHFEMNAALTPADMAPQVRRLAPRAVQGRRRPPAFIRRRATKEETDGWWTLGYQFDVILTRDPFLHRIDIIRATRWPMSATPENEGILVDDVVDEWVERHSSPYPLELSGPTGGRWQQGKAVILHFVLCHEFQLASVSERALIREGAVNQLVCPRFSYESCLVTPAPIATVSDALGSLRAKHPGLLRDLCRGDRVLWVGSGVSFDQVPGLEALLHRMLEFLQAKIDVVAPDDPHRDALDRIIEEHLPDELSVFRADPCAWPIPADLSALASAYSEVLGTEVGHQPQDYLLWDAVDVRETYGSPDIEPGPEHWLIAFLIHEGVVRDIVTTNWDGLIERAVEDSTPAGNPPTLAAIMSRESFRTARGSCNIYKAHGCAVLARKDAANRPYLVAQTTDVARWLSASIYAPMVERLRILARTRRSLMLGLSVQDYNLLAQIAGASEDLPWHWEQTNPAYMFAEPTVHTSQRNVLKVAYDNYVEHRVPICDTSATGMYSGLLLSAAVLHLVLEKMRVGVEYAPAFAGSKAVLDGLAAGVTRLETEIADEASSDLDRLVDLLRAGISSMTTRYLDPASNLEEGEYAPFYGQSLGLGVDNHFKRSGLPELSVTIGLLGLGSGRGHWTLQVGTGAAIESGVVQLTSRHVSGVSAKVVITRDWIATSALTATDLWTSDPGDVLVIQATGEHDVRYRRGIAGGIGSGRTSKRDRRQVWLSDLEPYASDIDGLVDAFRAEVSA